jgi:PucR C-terminal helix-turn-helix domain/GGDEF-like domain
MRIEEVPPGLIARLRARRGEIEQATLTRVYAVAAPHEPADLEYIEGLKGALRAGIEYGIAAVERGEEEAMPPPALLAQARLAARKGVRLDTVLRRYFAGFAVFSEFVLREAEAHSPLEALTPRQLLHAQTGQFDRLIGAVSAAHAQEQTGRFRSSEQRRAERVKRLLAGELVDAQELDYDLELWHLGAVAVGPGAARALRALAGALGARLLSVSLEDATSWAWFGCRSRLSPEALLAALGGNWPADGALAIGESVRGFDGWRVTHRQALAALPIARRGTAKVVRYADVALLASALGDDLLASSIEMLYLNPLAGARTDGLVLEETLRVYFRTGRNVSSTAAALGVNRNTVSNRLRAIESCIARPLDSCSAEMETALGLRELSKRQLR